MKRPFSPLVWLCAALTLALGALTLYDPSGIYAEYIGALDRNTPIIAAVFSAAQDGIYPWTPRSEADAAPRSPAYRPLTETVTDEEMRSSVGNDEPFSENASAHPEDSTAAAPSVESAASDEAAAPVPEDSSGKDVSAGTPGSPNAPQLPSGFVTVDESWFDDALFIGDSHIEGFCDYGGVPNATYYFKRGLDIWSVLTKSFVGGKQTIPQALSQRQFGKIYIMLGINEIGCGTTESYAAQYADVVARLRELQPNAIIYVQAIFHTSQKKSDSSIYNNDTINARNAAISALADGQHVFFVDCNAVFDDENGALTASYSGDGVHVKAPYYTMWRDYLLRFGLLGVTAADAPADEDATPIPTSSDESVAPPIPASAPAPVPPAAPTAAEPTPARPAKPVPAVPESAPAQPVESTPAIPESAPAQPVESTPAIPESVPAQSAEPAPAVPESTPAQPAEPTPTAAEDLSAEQSEYGAAEERETSVEERGAPIDPEGPAAAAADTLPDALPAVESVE